MTDQEKIEKLRDALKQFQYAAHEILSTQSDKMRLVFKLGDIALAATAPAPAKPDKELLDEIERERKEMTAAGLAPSQPEPERDERAEFEDWYKTEIGKKVRGRMDAIKRYGITADGEDYERDDGDWIKYEDHIAALKAAAEQEPMAWLHETHSYSDVVTSKVRDLWLKVSDKRVEYYTIPLYTHPIASEDSERLRFVLEHGLPTEWHTPDGLEYGYGLSPKELFPTRIEAIDAARREGK